MKTPDMGDIIGDLYDKLDNVEVVDTDFGDSANVNVEVPYITDLSGAVTYYYSTVTRTPYARVTWTWTPPVMHDEDGTVISPSDPDILDDINFDPVVDYMFGTIMGAGTPTAYASTNGSTSVVTESHTLGTNITGSVYAVLRSGIVGPVMNYAATVTKDTTAPGQPSAPTLSSAAAFVSVTYDGLLNGGGAQPSDYLYTEIMAGTANPPTTKVGEANGRGIYDFAATAGDTVYVQLFSYDTSMNRSVGSPVVSIIVKSVLDDTGLAAALASLNIYRTATDPVLAGAVADGAWWFKPAGGISQRVAGAWVAYTIDAALVIVAGTIVAAQIAAGAVTTAKLAASAVTANEIAADAVTTNKILAGNVTADRIATGAITANEIAANTITGAKLVAGTITGTQISATAIDGKTITGATVRTAASGARAMMDTTGFKTFNAAGTNIIKIGTGTGGAGGAGFEYIGIGTTTAAMYSEHQASGSHNYNAGVRTSIYSSSTSGYIDCSSNLIIYFPTTGTIDIGNSLLPTGTCLIHALTYINNNIWIKPSSSGSAANAVYSTADANGYRRLNFNSSIRAIKRNIEDPVISVEDVLKLRPRRWFDKGEMEDVGLDPDTATPDECLAAGLDWIPGFVAEEVEEIGLSLFCRYEKGELQGINYDRMSAALLTVIQKQAEQLASIEERLLALENRG